MVGVFGWSCRGCCNDVHVQNSLYRQAVGGLQQADCCCWLTAVVRVFWLAFWNFWVHSILSASLKLVSKIGMNHTVPDYRVLQNIPSSVWYCTLCWDYITWQYTTTSAEVPRVFTVRSPQQNCVWLRFIELLIIIMVGFGIFKSRSPDSIVPPRTW